MSSSASTAPASSFVPPRSTPMTQPSATSRHHTAPPWPTTKPTYTLYRSRPKLFSRGVERRRCATAARRPARRRSAAPPDRGRRRGCARPLHVWRVARLRRGGVAGWLLLSLVLFLISAQVQSSKVSRRRPAASSSGAGYPLTSPNTILVLGSDARTKGSKEPGANKIGQPSRSDSILLMRDRRRQATRRSRSRATRSSTSPATASNKINAAYAIGGPGAGDPDRRAVPRHPRSTTSSRSTSRTSRS